MIDPKITGTKVVFGPCRLSYTHVFSKYSPDGDPAAGKYSTNILIPKEEGRTVKALNSAIVAAQELAVKAKWGGKLPRKMDSPLRDGDDKDDDLYQDHWYLNAKSSTRPGIVDKNNIPIIDEEEIYSGVWALVSVTFFGYDVNGNRGIACGLNNIKKFKDGEYLGGRVSAESDFGGIDIEDDDDL